MELILPAMIFAIVFLAVLALSRQTSTVGLRLGRHAVGGIAVVGGASKPVQLPLRERLVHGRLATLATRSAKGDVKERTALLL